MAYEGVMEAQDDYLTNEAPNEELSSDAESALSPTMGVSRPALIQRSTSSRETNRWPSNLDSSTSFQPSTFTLPHRSIFSSALPTSFVSVNTAHASMSSPQLASSLHPLSTLSGNNSGASSSKRVVRDSPRSMATRRTRSTRIQKHADDPSTSMEDASILRRPNNRPTSLAVSNLFATTDLAGSRSTSFVQATNASQYIRSSPDSTMALPSHLYMRGLIDGKHSDITVNCFGTSYALHRLLLDRAPFFCSALSEPWFESKSKEIALHPEEIDSNITQTAFELALRRIYGCADLEEEDKNPIGLFATGCWLEMSDLIEASISSILKQLEPSNIADCIKFVTGSYYGKHGERILTAAKAMLYREGYEMLLKNFSGISGELIRDILSSDAFYVPGEWERWILARKIFNRRVRAKAMNLGIINANNSMKIAKPKMSSFVLRDQVAYETEIGPESSAWIQLYADPDISPLYELFDTGIHYTHMSFEQLQQVKVAMDVLGVIPLVTESTVSNALWQSMLLRQRIINAAEADPELGFTEYVEEQQSPAETQEPNALDEGVRVDECIVAQEDTDEEIMDISGEKAPQTIRYWIPVSDSTYQLGTGSDGIGADATSPKNQFVRSQLTDQVDPSGLFSEEIAEDLTPKVANCPGPKLLYTEFPPFRFAAEFPPTKSLKENKRVYSNTVWYAGSLWNVYIQKKETSKSTQLGIYLHREKHVEGAEDLMRSMAHNTGVDERISSIEKELYLRQKSRRRFDNTLNRSLGDTSDFYTDLLRSRMPSDLDTLSGLVRPRSTIPKSSEEANLSERPLNTASAFDEEEEIKDPTVSVKKPALPPYVDSRSTIKTYFKIYAPSRGGRMMSVYESAPDQFNFSQSWGWKSSNLVIDDSHEVGTDSQSVKEPRLRFMVVIGNV